MHFLPESHAFTHKATLTSHWHSWRITLDESPVTIYIWGLRALAVNQNTEVVLGWCREQLVDAQGRSHLHFQCVLPHYLCHRATSSTVAFYVLIFFPTHSDFRLQFDLLFAKDVHWKGNWVATSCKTKHFDGPQDTFLHIFYYSSKRELKGLHGPLYSERFHGFFQHFGLQRIKLAKYVFALTAPLGAVNLNNIL